MPGRQRPRPMKFAIRNVNPCISLPRLRPADCMGCREMSKLGKARIMTNRDDLRPKMKTSDRVIWEIADALVPYPQAMAAMDRHVDLIGKGEEPERVWLLEHPPLYTAGTSAHTEDLVEPSRFPVFKAGRGGQYTYHGPGQRVAYVMLDLKRRGGDVRAFVTGLEQWVIDTLDQFNVRGERREDRVGVWVRRGSREDKIAAIGIRVRHSVSFHGISINVEPDLLHFSGIVPCGIREHGVTSLVDLGLPVTMQDLDVALKLSFHEIFGG
jgi:lipoyl(octanoyl) transferase